MGVSAEGLQTAQSLGGAMSAVGRFAANQRNEADQAGESRRMAELSEQEAERAANRKREEAEERRGDLRERQRRDRARSRAGWGRSGLSLLSGSPLAVLEGRAADDEREQLDVLADGERAASGELAAGASAAARYRGRASTLRGGSGWGPALGEIGSLLSGGGKLYDL